MIPPEPLPAWHELEADSVQERLGTPSGGLTRDEVLRRRSEHGPNTIGEEVRTHPALVLARQFRGPLILILVVALVVSAAIGRWEDAIVISVVLVLNATVGFVQELRAESAIAALSGLVAPRAVVVRDGERQEVDSRDIVPGDLVRLESGSVVPADLRLLRAAALSLEEALLTGESAPVHKRTERMPEALPVAVADRVNMAFMGTSVASGRATGVVVATGKRTEIGRIAGAIRAVPKTKMPLQERMDRFGRLVSVAIVLLAGLTLCLGILRGEALSVMFLTAVAIAVSAVPEGLPVVMTITLAVSARRMARRNALVRRLPAVETLGSCTVIATDKTGTMTENRMTVSVVWDGSSRFDFLELPRSRAVAAELAASGEDSALRWTLLAGLLCNEASLGEPIPDGEKVDPDSSASDGAVPTGDPIDIALLDAARRAGLERPVEDRRRPQVNQVPFESSLGWAASVRQDGHELVTLVKGAPERVAEMCGRFLGDASGESFDAEVVRDEAARLGAEGLRVLGMAVGFGAEAANAVLKGGDQPKVLAFAGLVGMIDPPRPEVSEAVAACAAAGIRVIMVTGDHRSTALAVARQTGVVSDGDDAVLAGEELATLSDQELAHLIQRVRVFARVSPHDKLRIVEAMEGVGHVVAVTGDGANDAPALKAAHVGAAMGLRGTDVAKEASDIVLADDHFATVGAAVEEGRNAFANLRNATFFLVSSGAGELMAILASLFLRLPLPVLPAQILWLNVVTNGVEDVALAVEPPDPRRFRRPPRSPREGILSRRLWERLFLTGLVMAVGTLWIFTTEWGGDPERLTYARVAALTALVVFQVFHVGSCRSEERSVFALSPFSNRFLFFGVGLSLILHIGALYVPVTQTLLQLEPLTLESWARIVAVATTVILAVELHKLVRGDATGSVTA